MSVTPFDDQPVEVERYELRALRRYTFEADRREFVQTLGAGLLVAAVARVAQGQRRGRPTARRDEPLSQRFHLGEDGTVTVLTSKVEVGQGSRTQITQAAAEELRLPVERLRLVSADSPLRQGSYRALASTANTFARESATDELADLAGSDPLAFRLQHLEDGRLKNVLIAAVERFDWSRRRANRAAGRGVGLACGTEKGSFVAACAEVEVVDEVIRVVHVCQAYECGAIQNPANLRAQVEGAMIMGLGGALYEAIEFEQGQIANPDFSGYRVPRMHDLPELVTVLLDRRDLPSVGGGETPIIAVAPAIANAVYDATGIRSRSMPLRGIEVGPA